MSLRDLIETYAAADAESAKWDAVATTLNTPSIEQRTSTKVSFDVFISTIGTETAEAVLKELSLTEIGTSLRRRLEISGLDFSDAATIEQLDKIGAKVTSAVLKKLKELGVRLVSLAGEVVTADQCRDAWLRAALEKVADDLYQAFTTRYNNAKASIDDGSLTTAAQVTAVIGGA